MTTIRRAGVAVMEIPDEILKPVFAAIGAMLLAATGWTVRKLFVAPFNCAKLFCGMPKSVHNIGKAIDGLHDHMVRQGVCLDVMLANGTYGVFECDPDANNITVNDTYCRFLGAVPGELMGRGWEAFIKPAERARYAAEWLQAMENGRDFTSKLDFTHSNGSTVRTIIRSSKIVQGGEVVGYMGFIRLRPPGAD